MLYEYTCVNAKICYKMYFIYLFYFLLSATAWSWKIHCDFAFNAFGGALSGFVLIWGQFCISLKKIETWIKEAGLRLAHECNLSLVP